MAQSITELGITEVTRPVGAILLGWSLPTLNRHIAADRIAVAGRVFKYLSVAEIEEIRGRPVTAEEFVAALASTTGHEPKTSAPHPLMASAKPERLLMDIIGDYTDYLSKNNVSF